MTATTMNTTAGQTIAREALILYLNTSTTSTPTWSAIGKRVEDASLDYDWNDSNVQDILGNVYAMMRKPVITESFDPYYLDSGDAAIAKIWDLAVVQQDAQALCNLDLLLVHFYGGSAYTPFAERYPTSMVKITGLGGEGGGNLEMPIEATFGGERVIGTASRTSAGVVTFTEAA